jgi:SAM-dependent methyltransferase
MNGSDPSHNPRMEMHAASKRRQARGGDMRAAVGRQLLPGGGGKNFAGVTGVVQTLYEEYPYPQFRQVTVCPDAAAHLGYAAHRCYRPEPFRPRRILVAGCGTIHAVGIAASYPAAAVVGIDISQKSLQIAERMAEDLRLTNLQLRQKDILTFSGHDGEFDFIDCYGVLHHTAEPPQGLRNLAQALAPDGLMSIMVYSQRVRREIGEFQQLFRMLNRVREARGEDSSLGGRMAFAHRLAHLLGAADTRLKTEAQKAAALFREDRTQFADTYVQPQELRYTLGEVLGLVKGASLDLVNFVHEREWDPAAYLDDPALLSRLQSLPREDRWRFCDVAGSPFYHFLCAHPAAAPPRPRPCLADDGLMLDIVPHPCAVHSYPLQNNRVDGPALREPREGQTFARRGNRVRFRGSLGELDAPPIVLDYIRLADGKRTVREIAAAAARLASVGLPDPAQAAAAFRALFGMIPYLAPDATRCRRCPGRCDGSEPPAAHPGVPR